MSWEVEVKLDFLSDHLSVSEILKQLVGVAIVIQLGGVFTILPLWAVLMMFCEWMGLDMLFWEKLTLVFSTSIFTYLMSLGFITSKLQEKYAFIPK
jgi:hypothetical protein